MTDADYQLRKNLICQGKLDQAQQADKAVLTLASSAFGLSLAFIHNAAPEESVSARWLLGLGWLLLLASCAAVLLSFRFSVLAHVAEDNELERRRANPDCGDTANPWIWWIETLNWASLATLIFGAALVALFVVVNL